MEQSVRAGDLPGAAALLPPFDAELARLLPELHALQQRAA
jgi:hypothetical protein